MAEFESASLFLQSVSPGSVEAHLSDQETVPEAYPSVSLLQAEDVAESIAYVLSAPHHVEVRNGFTISTEENSCPPYCGYRFKYLRK